MQTSDLPAVNATLNAIAAICLIAGYVQIRRGRRELHKRCMLAALTASAIFLVCYVIYHVNTGSRPFPGQGVIRVVYFSILITHVILAATILPLALMTAARGPDRPICSARPDRAMDAAAVALRLGNGCPDLSDALSVVLSPMPGLLGIVLPPRVNSRPTRRSSGDPHCRARGTVDCARWWARGAAVLLERSGPFHPSRRRARWSPRVRVQ